MTLTASQIKTTAQNNAMTFKTVIPGQFSEIEYLAVTIKPFITAYFLMNNTTFEFAYSHTYNAITDKTTKRTPSQFR
jgi:hypothetical protein